MSSPRSMLAIVLAAAAAAAAAGPTATARQAGPDEAVLAALGSASHVIIPQARSVVLAPRPQAPARPVIIDAVRADIAVRDRAATTTLEVALRNTSSRQEEAVLLLPIPEGAVVSGLAFEGGGAEPTLDVMERDEARGLYDAIVAKSLDPALLEFAGYNLIRSSVFPVPAGGTQRLRVTYEHLLTGDGSRIDYVLPRSESLDRRRPWQITMRLDSSAPISTVYSPSHALNAERTGPGAFTIRLDDRTGVEPGAFRLSYLLERDGVSSSVFAYPDPEIGGGYFLLMAGLPAEIDPDAAPIKREVTVVIDRSGSMAGVKMDQVRAAALQVIEGLADGEAFNIIDYSTTVRSFAARPVVKDRTTTADARAYLREIRPGGGTNIHDALMEALRQRPHDGMLPIVLFLTDGLPTIGRTGEVEIRRMVAQTNTHERRVFTFGVGEDVNVPLLDRVADLSRAASTYVLPDEDVEVKVAQVFRQLKGPVLAEPRLTAVDADGRASTRLVQELIPGTLPDLFDGDHLVVLGQYREDEPMTLRLDGNYLGQTRAFEVAFDPAAASARYAFVPRLWASRRIAFLIDQIRQAGAESAQQPIIVGTSIVEDPRLQELVDEILQLSTKHGILTEYTAFLATDGTDLNDWNGLRAGCSNALDARAVRTRAGVGALNQALNYRQQKSQARLNYSNRFVDARLEAVETAAVQQMCDLAFFRRGNQWIDSRFIALDSINAHRTIIIGSPDHFALLHRLSLEGRQGVLALTGEILLLVDGQVIRITDGC